MHQFIKEKVSKKSLSFPVVLGVFFVCLLITSGVFAPYISPVSPNTQILEYRNNLIEEKKPFAEIDDVIKAINHVVNLVGIDHVGFGSDFDGLGNSLPYNLKDVSDYPNIILELLKNDYSEEEIEKICYKNLFRTWNEVLNYANN